MRQDISRFEDRGVDVIVTGPDRPEAFVKRLGDAPFTTVPDPDHAIAGLYSQEVSILKLGRMPAAVAVDASGTVRLVRYGSSPKDIPSTDEVLEALSEGD